MSKYNPNQKAKPYAVIARWKDNPTNFQILEYFDTEDEATKWMKSKNKCEKCDLEVAKYE